MKSLLESSEWSLDDCRVYIGGISGKTPEGIFEGIPVEISGNS